MKPDPLSRNRFVAAATMAFLFLAGGFIVVCLCLLHHALTH